MIDKLKLAHALEGGPIDRAKAEAIADAIGDHVKDLGIASLQRKLDVLTWMVGANTALGLLVLGKVLLI